MEENKINEIDAGEVTKTPKKEFQSFTRNNVLYGSLNIKIGEKKDGTPIYKRLSEWKIKDLDDKPWLNWKPKKTTIDTFRSRDQEGNWHVWTRNENGIFERTD
jgi:hypothetical protein